MPTKPRSEIFRPGEQAIVHVMNRCVRREFLLEIGANARNEQLDRRYKFEKELQRAAGGFAIDLLSYAIMDNHFHLILRSRPDVVLQWDNKQVVLQWNKLCPLFRNPDGSPNEKPTDFDLQALLDDTEQIDQWRSRLSDISWFMKLVSQKIAKWCNALDGTEGHFWQGRYKAVLLLDERALLTCSMYVDLNRIKAELAKSLESSDYTSIQRRLQAFVVQHSMRCILAEEANAPATTPSILTSVIIDENQAQHIPTITPKSQSLPPEPTSNLSPELAGQLPDAHLAPVHIDEQNDPIGPHTSANGSRCSDKGFLPLTENQYVELLSWTADQLRHRHNGQKFDDSPPCLVAIQLEPETWCKLVTQFTDMFFVVAGMPQSVDNHRSTTGKRFYMPQQTRELLSA